MGSLSALKRLLLLGAMLMFHASRAPAQEDDPLWRLQCGTHAAGKDSFNSTSRRCDEVILELLGGRPGYDSLQDIQSIERLAYQEALQAVQAPEPTLAWHEENFIAAHYFNGGLRSLPASDTLVPSLYAGELVSLLSKKSRLLLSIHLIEVSAVPELAYFAFLGFGTGLSLGRLPRASPFFFHASLHLKTFAFGGNLFSEDDFHVFSPTSAYLQVQAPVGKSIVLYAQAGVLAMLPGLDASPLIITPFLEVGGGWGEFVSTMASQKVLPDLSGFKTQLAEATWRGVARRTASSDLKLSLTPSDRDTYFPDGLLSEGEQMRVTGFLRNAGDGTALDTSLRLACNVGALTLSSEGPLPSQLEPGGAIPVTLVLDAARGLRDGRALCTVQVTEGRGYHSNTVQLELQLERKGLPELEISEVRALDGQSGLADGNGDGKVQNGERLELQFLIQNVGRVTAFGLKAALQAHELTQTLDAPLVTQPTLLPGESTLVRSSFQVPPEFKRSSLSLLLELREARSQAIVGSRLETLAVDLQRALPTLEWVVRQPLQNGKSNPVTLRLMNKGGLKARDITVTLEGPGASACSQTTFQLEALEAHGEEAIGLTLRLPQEFDAATLQLMARLEAQGIPPQRVPIILPVVVRHPELAVVLRMAGQRGRSYYVQAGGPVELFLDVENSGALDAADVEVMVRSTADTFRWSEQLKVGKVSASQRYTQVIRSDRVPRALTGQAIPLEIVLTQANYPSSRQTMSLQILGDEAEVTRLPKPDALDTQVGFSRLKIASPQSDTPAPEPAAAVSEHWQPTATTMKRSAQWP